MTTPTPKNISKKSNSGLTLIAKLGIAWWSTYILLSISASIGLGSLLNSLEMSAWMNCISIPAAFVMIMIFQTTITALLFGIGVFSALGFITAATVDVMVNKKE
jgi:hypothetical protein